MVSRVVSLVVVLALANSLGDDRLRPVTHADRASRAWSPCLADLGFDPLYTREAARNRGSSVDYLGALVVLRKVVLAAAAALVILAVALGLGRGLGVAHLPGGALLVATAYANLLRNTFYAVGQGRVRCNRHRRRGASSREVLILYAGARSHGRRQLLRLGVRRVSTPSRSVYSLVSHSACSSSGVIRLRYRHRVDRAMVAAGAAIRLHVLLTNVYFRAGVADPAAVQVRSPRSVGTQFAYKPFEALCSSCRWRSRRSSIRCSASTS